MLLEVLGIYSDFAYIYDKLMYDIDYKKWADYIEDIFRKNNVKPSLVLDLGCGTGNMCIEMAARGYDMIGADISVDMLSCARKKSLDAGHDILYLNQDITDFELYGTVDAIVCLMDTVNYITGKKDLRKMFKLVNNYLNPGGLFIFDINSEYKLKELLGNNVFYEIDDDITYIWENKFDKAKKICRFDLTFFIKNSEGSFERHDEVHYERAYNVNELKELIADSKMDLVGTYNNLTLMKPTKKSNKIFFVCKK